MEVYRAPSLEFRNGNIPKLLSKISSKEGYEMREAEIAHVDSYDIKHCESNERRRFICSNVRPDNADESLTGSFSIRFRAATKIAMSFSRLSLSMSLWWIGFFFITINFI